jgi:hypothetical protein
MSRSKNPVNNFLSAACRFIGSTLKAPAPRQTSNPLKKQGAKHPPLLVWLAAHRSARRPGALI